MSLFTTPKEQKVLDWNTFSEVFMKLFKIETIKIADQKYSGLKANKKEPVLVLPKESPLEFLGMKVKFGDVEKPTVEFK